MIMSYQQSSAIKLNFLQLMKKLGYIMEIPKGGIMYKTNEK